MLMYEGGRLPRSRNACRLLDDDFILAFDHFQMRDYHPQRCEDLVH